MNIISLFAGAGGLDLGFKMAGFNIIWANEFDKTIHPTYDFNHGNDLDTRNIQDIHAPDIPNADGIIGGPPCQSWSTAGNLRGIEDLRGQLFYDFIRILAAKQPKFFVAENVPGMLMPKNKESLASIIVAFKQANYIVKTQVLNAKDYGVAQDRKRLFFVGFRNDLFIDFHWPLPLENIVTLKDAIGDLESTAVSAPQSPLIANHEYMLGGFSSIYMSRNRVRSWQEPSFTIQAGARHAPLHPRAPAMIKVSTDCFIFKPGFEELYRRLSVRECARIQSFPDSFIFKYNNISNGYKMVGNAVPPQLAYHLAKSIHQALQKGGAK